MVDNANKLKRFLTDAAALAITAVLGMALIGAASIPILLLFILKNLAFQ